MTSPYEINAKGEKVGKHPRDLSVSDFNDLGYYPKPLLEIIRERCIDCGGDQKSEARACPHVGCVSWPYRMGTNPLRAKRTLTEKQKENLVRGRRVNR